MVRPAWILRPHRTFFRTPPTPHPLPLPATPTKPSTPRPRWRPTAVKPRTIEEAGVRTTPCLDHRGHGGTGSLGQTFTSFHEGTTDAHQNRLPRIPSLYWLHTVVQCPAPCLASLLVTSSLYVTIISHHLKKEMKVSRETARKQKSNERSKRAKSKRRARKSTLAPRLRRE